MSALCSVTTYEAEAMSHSTGGGTLGGWNVWTNGYVAANHDFPGGTVSVSVVAEGTQAVGVWPHMTVSVAGQTVGEATVSTASWSTYTFNVPVSAGVKELRVAFDNDFYQNGQDRNLLVDKVSIGCPNGTGGGGGTGGDGSSGAGSGGGGAGGVTSTGGAGAGGITSTGGAGAGGVTSTGGAGAGGVTSTGGAGAGGGGGSCVPGTDEAESLSHSTGGPTASGWNLWSNGNVSGTHVFTGGPVTLTVMAHGSSAAGLWPHMTVSVGGAVVGSATVSGTAWQAYPFAISPAAGTQSYAIGFDNDFLANGEDRNLYLDKVSFSCDDSGVGENGGSASGGNSTGGSGTGGGFVPPTGGYVIRAPMLLAPETAIAHATRTADFYAGAADAQGGGFFTFLDRQAHPTLTNKSFIVESRDAYAFVRAFMLTGDKQYLALARQALDFLYAHGWDQAHDGFVFLGDRQGNRLADPSGSQSPKWSFTQHYGLVGITAMCEATRAALDCGWMDKGSSSLDRHLWDATPGREGYFNNASNDFSSVSAKGFTPTVDGITTHVLYQYLVTGATADRARFVALADEAGSHLVGNMTAPGVSFGFPEDFNNDWSINSGSTYGFVGHLFKTSWVLARAYMATGNSSYRQAARQVLSEMWNRGGFDRVNGAPNYDYHWTSGVGSTDKEYWQLEQGFTSGLTNWFIADNDADRATFLEMADRTLDFYMSHLVDPQGGIFFQVNADGSSAVRTDKGDQWEGCYHDVELAYFVYLDGNLLLWHRPVTLYYDFEPVSLDRSWVLSPLPVVDGRLAITGVTLDGNPYSNFDGPARRLDLPAGKGGVFAVTYGYVVP